ncbi:MAG TPA: DinB family protein [Terriglobia bacterium]|nr:DinB family protein [Terriglobia bacterium]
MLTNSAALDAPDHSEYDPYYGQYIALVQGNDIVGALERQVRETVALLAALTEEQANHRYAPDKWSVKEVVGHVTDAERIMSYRALRIARSDQTPIEGFEQDDYVRAAQFGNQPLVSLLEDFAIVRRATLRLFNSLSAEAWTRRGVANQKQVSVRALAWLIAGHELHHRRILQEKYLSA